MGASAPRGSDEAVRANQAASRNAEVRVARRMHEFAVIFCTLKYFVQRVFVAQLWSAAVSQKYDAALDLYGTKIHHPSARICTVVQCVYSLGRSASRYLSSNFVSNVVFFSR